MACRLGLCAITIRKLQVDWFALILNRLAIIIGFVFLDGLQFVVGHWIIFWGRLDVLAQLFDL